MTPSSATHSKRIHHTYDLMAYVSASLRCHVKQAHLNLNLSLNVHKYKRTFSSVDPCSINWGIDSTVQASYWLVHKQDSQCHDVPPPPPPFNQLSFIGARLRIQWCLFSLTLKHSRDPMSDGPHRNAFVTRIVLMSCF